jgi:hypothetical protein
VNKSEINIRQIDFDGIRWMELVEDSFQWTFFISCAKSLSYYATPYYLLTYFVNFVC